MGPARLGPDQPQEFDDRRARTVDVGNPHLVLLGPDTAAVDIAELGPKLQAAFIGGINVEWITPDVMRRASFWSSGCGSGAPGRPWPAARQRGGRRRRPELGRRPAERHRTRAQSGRDLEVTLGADAGATDVPRRPRAQGGRRHHPSGDALLSNLLPGTLIERTFRERIILVGVIFPG